MQMPPQILGTLPLDPCCTIGGEARGLGWLETVDRSVTGGVLASEANPSLVTGRSIVSCSITDPAISRRMGRLVSPGRLIDLRTQPKPSKVSPRLLIILGPVFSPALLIPTGRIFLAVLPARRGDPPIVSPTAIG